MTAFWTLEFSDLSQAGYRLNLRINAAKRRLAQLEHAKELSNEFGVTQIYLTSLRRGDTILYKSNDDNLRKDQPVPIPEGYHKVKKIEFPRRRRWLRAHIQFEDGYTMRIRGGDRTLFWIKKRPRGKKTK